MLAARGRVVGGLLAAHVADVGAAVVGGVGVHDFAVVAGLRNAEAVTFADDGRSVDNGNDEVFGFFAAANEGKNAVIGVVGVDPFETRSEEHTSELQSHSDIVCRLLLEKKKTGSSYH